MGQSNILLLVHCALLEIDLGLDGWGGIVLLDFLYYRKNWIILSKVKAHGLS